MILATKGKWQVEQGTTGNFLMIYDLRGDGKCLMVSHNAQYRTIDCRDDLSQMPISLKEVVRKWCEDKANELLAENKVVIDGGDNT